MTGQSDYIALTAGDTSLIIDCTVGGRPGILYWGQKLLNANPELLRSMTARQHAPGSADVEVSGSLMNEPGAGGVGSFGFSAHRAGHDWASLFRVTDVRTPAQDRVEIVCEDADTRIRATHFIGLDCDSTVLTCETEIENLGDSELAIDWCASATLPLDPRVTRLFGFTGRWSGEFQLEEVAPFQGSYVRDNKSGRTSHDSFPGLVTGTPETHEQAGPCFAFHLGWSGNSRVRVDRLSDGRAFVQMGEYFFPGEMSLSPGQTYRTPRLYAGFAGRGFSALSRKFHHHLRHKTMDGRIHQKPRPVHYNTWEAVYFDHDHETLYKLAEKAAEVGAERYILDDGWFGSRRNDKAGLGDWWPSEDVYPEGLGPLVEHVRGLGLEFGLWFEPEMVNPDSELFRQHPDWILRADGVEQVPFRSQFVLDLTRPEVSEYLFDHMHKLLSQHDISYVKMGHEPRCPPPGKSRPPGSPSTDTRALCIDRSRAGCAPWP